jgi:hypothetical protein
MDIMENWFQYLMVSGTRPPREAAEAPSAVLKSSNIFIDKGLMREQRYYATYGKIAYRNQ